jgi:hypothetical protein
VVGGCSSSFLLLLLPRPDNCKTAVLSLAELGPQHAA